MTDLAFSAKPILSDGTQALHLKILAVVVLAFALAPFFVYPIAILNILIFALFAASYNLLLSTSGLISFGHATYLGVAGYVTGYLCKYLGWTPELSILAGTLAATALGAASGTWPFADRASISP